MPARLLTALLMLSAFMFVLSACGEDKQAYDSSGEQANDNAGEGGEQQPGDQNELAGWLEGQQQDPPDSQTAEQGTPQASDPQDGETSDPNNTETQTPEPQTPTPTRDYITWQQVRDGAVTRTNPQTGVTWTVLGIRTDEGDRTRAAQNAENTLTSHPDIAGMVGLWAYNPPAILQAVEDRGKLDQVTIVGFDEDVRTLDGIGQGKIFGTVVQNPYGFGFRSVQYLSATIRGQDVDVPNDGLIYIPTRVITRDNVGAFSSLIRRIRAGDGPVLSYDADAYDTSERVSMHFVTNLADPFWELAREGCIRGAEQFNADVTFFVPPTGQVAEQLAHVETMIVNDVDGLAISVRSPEGQVEMVNDWCEDLTVITVDSDAPGSDRLYYLGTDNIAAGRQVGELMAQGNPDGGKVMIFVGALDQANAYERSQGVIDALFGQTRPAE